MLVTPRKSDRTARPTTIVTNHIKGRVRENAGRSNCNTFHHVSHNDRGDTKFFGSGLAKWDGFILSVESIP